MPVTVYALRKDGFSGEVSLALKDAQAGFTLGGARVPADQNQVRVTLAAPPAPAEEPVSLTLEGCATIDGQQIRRPVVPAEDMMQAFAYRHLVPSQELRVTVLAGQAFRAPPRILGEGRVKIQAGGTAQVLVGTPTRAFMDRFQFELSEPPDGVTIRKVSPTPQGAEIVLGADAAKVKPGQSGNLIINIFSTGAPGPARANMPANRRRASAGTLPAIPFDIVAQ